VLAGSRQKREGQPRGTHEPLTHQRAVWLRRASQSRGPATVPSPPGEEGRLLCGASTWPSRCETAEVRKSRLHLLGSTSAGLAAGIWCATYGKIDPPVCSMCPVAPPHVAWGWTLVAAVAVAGVTELVFLIVPHLMPAADGGGDQGGSGGAPRRQLRLVRGTIAAMTLASAMTLLLSIVAAAPWSLDNLHP
jgi:hypothetical protein